MGLSFVLWTFDFVSSLGFNIFFVSNFLFRASDLESIRSLQPNKKAFQPRDSAVGMCEIYDMLLGSGINQRL